jgi:hypothetical protein
MSFFNLFTRKRHRNPTQGNIHFVKGAVFSPGAEVFAAESKVGDPLYTLTVFPQWNFTPLEVYQTPMVFQALSLPANLPAGFPFGGMRSTNLIQPEDYPDVEGNYWS